MPTVALQCKYTVSLPIFSAHSQSEMDNQLVAFVDFNNVCQLEEFLEFIKGGFQLECCEDFQAFSRNHFAKIPRKVGASTRPFCSRVVCSSFI